MMMKWRTCVALSFMIAVIASSSAHEPDLVVNLPGQPNVGFKHYAGYVTVDPGPQQRALFYWFFEADHPNASTRPLALWLQGGPGCSSEIGALGEIGPFSIENGSLVTNKQSWNKELNLIFLDSPVGAGFSYNDNPNYNYTDDNTAVDSYKFLVGWFQKFPKYSTNDFYLLGESYAGHFVPRLAERILLENRRSGTFHMNFKGFSLGNPWTDSFLDNKGGLEWYLYHSIISHETFDLALQSCDLANSYYLGEVGNKSCMEATKQVNRDMAKVNLNNVYEESCNIENATNRGSNNLSTGKRFASRWKHGEDPCSDGGFLDYLNDPQVHAALHIRRSINWTFCSDLFNIYNHADKVASMLPIYQKLLKADIRIWIYSGDWDGNVPTTGTQAWIQSLKLPIVTKWHAWNCHSQVGGWTQVYQGLTFATVRGAGHMVPTDKPDKALLILESFLAGKPLPVFHY